jgi:hypothetical protein
VRSETPLIELSEVFSAEECAREIARATKIGFQAQQFRGEERVEVRNRASIDDLDSAGVLWTRVSSRLPPLTEFFQGGLRPAPDVPDLDALSAVGLNERLRYYRYSGGQRFAPHVDLSHSEGVLRSFLTFIVYLNDDFDGGETDFFGHSVTPKTGVAIAFPHECRHEGRPVFRGTKYVLRTDVMYREASTGSAV